MIAQPPRTVTAADEVRAPEVTVGATSVSQLGDALPALPAVQQAALARADLRARWAAGRRDRVEDYLAVLPAIAADPWLVAELAFQEFLLAGEQGLASDPGEQCRRFPASAADIQRLAERWASLSIPTPGEPSAPTDRAGYELLGELGRGGMGVVYRARHRRLNRMAALKMILGGDLIGSAQKARFQAEAQALARLNHPHIVQVYEAGEADGCPFIALELVDGGTLSDRLKGGVMPPREAADLLEVLAWAVEAAHGVSIIHRDLKPSNILLRKDGSPVITDFGLAKHLDTDSGTTRTGAVLGTPAYMAPEQALGRREVGPSTDVYALGAILYECLVGVPPFRGETVQMVMIQVIHDQPLPPSHLRPETPPALEAICLKCLEKEPSARYATAGELARDLQRFLRGGEVGVAAMDREQWFSLWAKRAGYELTTVIQAERAGAVVYRARQVRFRREVALKVVTAEATERLSVLERWERQAAVVSEVLTQYRTAGRADRPPVVEVYDLGERDGLAYCATEFVPGGSVVDVLERVEGNVRSKTDAVERTRRIAVALSSLHTLGHAHGNVSPGNVLFAADGSVTFTDLNAGQGSLSDDIFRLGCLLFLLLTGRSVNPRAVVAPGSLRPDVPPRLDAICLGCLDEPARRFRTAFEVADALAAFQREAQAQAGRNAASVDRGIPPGFTHCEPLGTTRLGRLVKARTADGSVVVLHLLDVTGRIPPIARKHFRDTVRATTKLHHAHLHATFDVIEHEGRIVLVQEYHPGGTLSQRLTAGPLPADAAAEIAASVADVLHFAHTHHVFHGDLDPDKVAFAEDGSIRVSDFRLVVEVEARRVEDLAGPLDVQLETRAGYKPPEYLRRDPIEFTPAADVYALGALLAEMLTGASPDGVFGREAGSPGRGWLGLERVAAVARRKVAIPHHLDAICRKAMAWKPGHRYATVGQFAAELREQKSGNSGKGWLHRIVGG